MKSLVHDALAYGLRLIHCSDPQLASLGGDLRALGDRLDDAHRAHDGSEAGMLCVRLCSLARRVAELLERTTGVVFHSVTPKSESSGGWLTFFNHVDAEPVPVHPQQLEWLAEAACVA